MDNLGFSYVFACTGIDIPVLFFRQEVDKYLEYYHSKRAHLALELKHLAGIRRNQLSDDQVYIPKATVLSQTTAVI